MVRKRVEIDEDTIRDMMRGDIPRLKHAADESVSDNSKKEDNPVTESPAPAQPVPEKKQDGTDYASVFLKKRDRAVRRQIYVNREIYIKIAGILPVIAPDLTVFTYIDNVLADHLERYRDQINIIYENNAKKPL